MRNKGVNHATEAKLEMPGSVHWNWTNAGNSPHVSKINGALWVSGENVWQSSRQPLYTASPNMEGWESCGSFQFALQQTLSMNIFYRSPFCFLFSQQNVRKIFIEARHNHFEPEVSSNCLFPPPPTEHDENDTKWYQTSYTMHLLQSPPLWLFSRRLLITLWTGEQVLKQPLAFTSVSTGATPKDSPPAPHSSSRRHVSLCFSTFHFTSIYPAIRAWVQLVVNDGCGTCASSDLQLF